MRNLHSPEFSRNYGFWNEAEQQAIMDTNVAIAGVGGDGFQLGIKLAMMGVQTFDVADPEVFEPQNTNRVPGARNSTFGINKAEVFRDQVLDINPDADVRIYTDGLTADNVEEFLSRANLSFDESELTYLHIGTMLAREARKRSIPNVLVMNIGFAAQVTSFKPKSKHTFESLMGFRTDMPLDEVSELKVDLSRCVPYLPPYTDMTTLVEVSKDPREVTENGVTRIKKTPLPSIAPGVDIASAIGTSQAFLHMVQKVNNNRPAPTWAPKIAYMDALTMTTGTTKFPRLSHNRYGIEMMARNKVGKAANSSYSEADRDRRDALEAESEKL